MIEETTMKPRLLSKDEFFTFCADPMKNVTASPEPSTDIWPYVDSLDPIHVGIGKVEDVEYVFRDAGNRYDHVVLKTDRNNVNLVVIVSRQHRCVVGHHLLDLNVEYGLASQH